MTLSQQRKTATDFVAAFEAMDIDKIISYRHPDCMRHILPTSLGYPPSSNMRYAHSLNQLKPIFHNFSLTINDVLEDKEARRVCMYLSARADTVAGEYINEYVWILDFDESGKVVLKSQEFVDTVVNKEFYPKLQAAMRAHRENLLLTPPPDMNRNNIDTAMEAHMARLLSSREPPKTFCPSEVARAFSQDELQACGAVNWRDLMSAVRELAWTLRKKGELEILQQREVLGDEVGLEDVKGPLRLRRRVLD